MAEHCLTVLSPKQLLYIVFEAQERGHRERASCLAAVRGIVGTLMTDTVVPPTAWAGLSWCGARPATTSSRSNTSRRSRRQPYAA